MKTKFSDAGFWDFVMGVGKQYQWDDRMGSKGLITALKVADLITGTEREDGTIKLLNYLTGVADQNVADLDDRAEITRVSGACLVLGRWQVQDSAPTISRFLQVSACQMPNAAIDSLEMIAGKS